MNANKDYIQDINFKIANLKQQVQQKINQPYLCKFIKAPFIDEDKLLLLLSIFERLHLPERKMDKYIVTTMLVQIALDTHESVENQALPPEQLKSRQLTILAGTYYSGLYYQILAEIDDINMIRTLAEGIMDVNEHKISVYSNSRDTVESLMESLKKTESSLFDRITGHFKRNDLGELAANIVLVKRLMAEKDKFVKGMYSVLFDSMHKLLINDNLFKADDNQQEYLLSISDKYIDLSIQEAEKWIKQLSETAVLAEKLESIKLKQTVKSFVEEG